MWQGAPFLSVKPKRGVPLLGVRLNNVLLGLVTVVTSIVFCALLRGIVGTVAWVIIKTSDIDREKLTPFECGFDPKSMRRLPFSFQFFLISIIFLIFDVEITLLLPTPLLVGGGASGTSTLGLFSFFVLVLLGGLFYE